MTNFTIKQGDSVVFAQRYFKYDNNSSITSRTGKVKKILEDGEHCMVEFKSKPGVDCKVAIEDLEHATEQDRDAEMGTSAVPYDQVEEFDEHDLGGMNRAQLIAEKLIAQECDPGLDKSIHNLLN